MEKTHYKKVFNSDYLGSCDLDDGKDLKAIIKHVTVQKVKNTDGKETERNVATFTDPKIKPMVLNVTNCKTIKKFAGSPYINDWNNIAVQIYVKDDIRAFGEVTDGLRIRDKQPDMTKPKLTKTLQPAWDNVVKALKADWNTISKVKEKYDVSASVEAELKEAVK